MLIDDAVRAYLDDKARRLRGNTLEGYVSALRRHVMPEFSGRDLESVTHDEVQAWVDSISTYGAAEKAFKTFRQVYRWSMRRFQLRVWDVTQGIELPAKPVVRRPVLTADEERATLRGVMGQPWEAVVLCEAALGLRRSEACGLDWSDFDWRRGWVHVRRGAHWVGGRLVEYATKTKLSDRWLRVPRWALARLRQLRGALRSGRLRGALAPHQIAGRFQRFCKRFSLPWVPMTCLRHSWATIALEAGAAIEDVAVALGHTGVDTCVQHYLQSFRTVVGRAAEAYEGAMLAAQDSVSQIEEDTGWLYLWQSGGQFVRYRRLGPLVHLWWLVVQPTSAYWTCPTPLPEGLRPHGNTYIPAVLTDASGYASDHAALCCVEGNGSMGFQAGVVLAGAMNRGSGCFVAL